MKQKINLLLVLCSLNINVNAQISKIEDLKNKSWNGEFNLKDTIKASFEFYIANNTITIKNGKERIEMQKMQSYGDSISTKFQYYNTELRFKINKNDSITGRWINHTKQNYSIPFTAKAINTNRINSEKIEKPTVNVTGKWETTFSKNGIEDSKAIGLFSQKKDKVSGTFLTETGDYRFLEGNIYGNRMYLTAFDGSHIYLFNSTLNNQRIEGKFYSGSQYEVDFYSIINEQFTLRNASEITKVVNKQNIEFEITDLNGNLINFNAKEQNTVTIIQIMGSWCGNCIDESKFFNELYKQYNKKGLEIIALAFEVGTNKENQLNHLKDFKNKMEIDYPIYYAGKANKKEAAELFNNIFNGIYSFPTTLILDKKGNVNKVYSGFSGPSTGSIYLEYVKEMKQLIESLLKNK